MEAFEEFLRSPPERRFELVQDPRYAEAVRAKLGEPAFAEYLRLAGSVSSASHLAIRSPKNLLFVPGVMGSQLKPVYLPGVWWLDVRTRNRLKDLQLNPEGTDSLDPNNAVEPFALDPSYGGFFAAVLGRDDFGHVQFAYDWRRPLEASASRLRDAIVAAHAANGKKPVHVVAHSMGGLLVRTMLLQHGDAELWGKLGRIVFIGTPHYGSPAIAGYLKNHLWGFELLALLGRYIPRETFRSLWGVLSMLPAPPGVYPEAPNRRTASWEAHPCANFDLYAVQEWGLELSPSQQVNLQRILAAAARRHEELFVHQQNLVQERRDRMAVIAGVGFKTLFRLTRRSRLAGLWQDWDKELGRETGNRHRDGDGRVPLASACLEHVGATRYVKAEHGTLPNVPAVYEDVFRWLSGEPLELPESPKGALGAHLGSTARSATPALDGSARIDANSDDPGYWNERGPSEIELAEVEAQVTDGKRPEFERIRIL
jgi:pimeloyl-ACP methyl ester carboxylesterase